MICGAAAGEASISPLPDTYADRLIDENRGAEALTVTPEGHILFGYETVENGHSPIGAVVNLQEAGWTDEVAPNPAGYAFVGFDTVRIGGAGRNLLAIPQLRSDTRQPQCAELADTARRKSSSPARWLSTIMKASPSKTLETVWPASGSSPTTTSIRSSARSCSLSTLQSLQNNPAYNRVHSRLHLFRTRAVARAKGLISGDLTYRQGAGNLDGAVALSHLAPT
jgi:hypothetical protein